MKAFEESKHFDAPTSIYKIVSYAEPIVSIGNQTGEGWFLTGEMVELIKEGVPNIVCTQPFGCLPNHVVGKGVIKALRKAYPSSNIVAIDYDPGASEVNQLNRIKLMLSTAQKNLKRARVWNKETIFDMWRWLHPRQGIRRIPAAGVFGIPIIFHQLFFLDKSLFKLPYIML